MTWRTHAVPDPTKPKKVVTIDIVVDEAPDGRSRSYRAYCEEFPELETKADSAVEAASLMRHNIQHKFPEYEIEALLNGAY